MRLATLRRKRTEPAMPGLHATARVVRSGLPAAHAVADLARRAKPGDLVVIDCLDLDAAGGRLLAGAGVAAVVNTAPFVSGRFPARGALVLVESGVALLDRVGPELTRVLLDGDKVRLDGPLLFRGDDVVARGEVLDLATVHRLMDRARAGLAVQLEAFMANTAQVLRHEADLFLDGDGVPELSTRLAKRPVLLVAAGPGWQEDLARLRPWMKAAAPVLVGVDEGADALLAVGLKPHLIVGNPEVITEEALGCGAEIVVRAERGGSAPGLDRAEAHQQRPVVFPVGAASEDAALLLAHTHDANLIVTVGSRTNVTDLVDRARPELAAGLLARLKAGGRVVDGAAVARVYRQPAPAWPLWLLLLVLVAGLAAVVVISGDASPVGQWRDEVLRWAEQLWRGRG